MDFLPKTYEVPEGQNNNYMRLQKGENRIRVISDEAVLGYEYWVGRDASGKGGTPIRIQMSATVPTEYADSKKHFWIMGVWNYAEEKIQLLEITQSTIQKSIKRLYESPDWGNPNDYDLLIIREGESKQDTRYSVQPTPKTKMDDQIIQSYKDANVDLTAVFRNEDPFKA